MPQSLLPPLGVGLPYIAALPAELYRPGLIDFVEVTPETLCRQQGTGRNITIELIPDQMARAQQTCAELPIVVHGVELSIGSAHGWNEAYLEMLDAFQAAWPFLWHSEHLGFQTMPGEGGETQEIGVPLPLPPTQEAAELVASRCAILHRRYKMPFLLENPAHYLSDLPSDPEIGDEIGLMRAITANDACMLLLDLHNVYCNAVNHRFDPFREIDRMPLECVGELHIAGGSWHDGFWMDAHDGCVPERVWELLEYTLPRCPQVAGVVFELLEEHAVRLGADAIRAELIYARAIWDRSRGG
ncbi:MAG TPA: DUF692 family protein [Chthonomonadaceae bacterium]|nr:DUF692 family protein [Chthonomonadaceae bacterium]